MRPLKPTPQTQRPQLWWTLIASVLIHAGLFWVLTTVGMWDGAPAKDDGIKQESLRVRVLDDSQLPASLHAKAQQPTKLTNKEQPKQPKPPEKPKEKPKDPTLLTYSPSTQIEREQEPDKARFSGRQSNSVEKEMIKRGVEGTPNPSPVPPKDQTQSTAAQLAALARSPDPSKRPTKPQETPAQDDAPEQDENQQAPQEVTKQGPSEPDLILPTAKQHRSKSLAMRSAQESQGAINGSPDLPPQALFPTVSNTRQFDTERGDGGTFNALRDIDEGERTLLNRKHTRYWTFFDRMKRQLQREWNPGREYNKRDPYRNIYGVKDRYTVVNLTLNADGTVQKLHLAQSSGLDFYDDEAIRALLAAAPFPNPPEGLKDEDGLIHIRYGFYLQISTGSSRFFRVR